MRVWTRLLPVAVPGTVLAILLLAPWPSANTVIVAANDDLQTELDLAPKGSLVLLQKGAHEGGVIVEKRMTIRGLAGASIVGSGRDGAALTVMADGAVIENLGLEGGSSGLIVREAEDVLVRDVTVTGSALHGIEVVDAAAFISGSRVDHLQHEMSQGIEVRNSDGRPDTVVEDSVVRGGQEGIVSHVSEVVVRDNQVAQTTMRAITITEMSDGAVEGNKIADVTGAALYCGDMSRCEFSDNQVSEVAASGAGPSAAGWGLVVTHHAVASSDKDHLVGDGGGIYTSLGGHLSDESPLDPRGDWMPVVAATGAAVLSLWVLYRLSVPSIRIFDRFRRRPLRLSAPRGVLPLVSVGLAVQTFHMVEHGLQVFRVRIDQIPSRGGLVGPSVEGEWIHFIYNLAVFGAICFVAAARARGWEPQGRREVGDRLLVAGLFVQGYHAVEHAVKLGQHLTGGAKVNPGIAGEYVDLVLLHYSINLVVYLTLVGCALAYGSPLLGRLKRPLRTPDGTGTVGRAPLAVGSDGFPHDFARGLIVSDTQEARVP